ncbi:MAG: type II secretion system F family protein [Bryobacterales bacterium]|nr:type II secretion system F family protein [Acidobacteriota bacterium]MCB9384450.1 type II secretion system F family protein [Bryobacterales bacterium]
MDAFIASILLFAVISVALTALGFKFWVQPQTAVERVMGEVEMSAHRTTDPSLSFRDLLTRIGNMVPANPTDVGILQRRLLTAGIRNPRALRVLYGMKVILASVFTLLASGAIFGSGSADEMAPFQIVAAAGLGWAGPNFIVSRLAQKRQEAIRKGLPNALDMLVICVESGLGLDQALMQVSKELHLAHPEITDEFAVLNLEMRAGKRRAEALHNLGERTGVEELRRMVSVLVQADKFGTSISQTLRNFSDYMRVQMKQEAEEKAAKIGVKLVFPIFFFILPSLFFVTVGPMVVRVTRDFLPRIMGS